MTVQPRKLKLLIIDDELSVSPGGYDAPEPIERLSPGAGARGIDSWRTAMKFWSAFQGGDVPDIVVADVRFIRDLDSPLSNLFKAEENNIPTGLSHLKTFAVLSRALGQPMGVAIRTMDRGLWERQIKSIRAEERAMGYLAIQEIGELASILGDGDELINGAFNKQRVINKCMEWFKKTSADTFEDGLKQAIDDYRRHLLRLATSSEEAPVVFVRPSHYAQLMGWCRQMSEKPQPLNEQCDPGIELTYRDGRHDLISLASLFCDFGGIASRPLGASAFSTDEREHPWKLDDDGRPRIAAFLQGLGSLSEACSDAAEAVLSYSVNYPPPTEYRPPTLATIKSRYSALTAGLVVVFQFIKIEEKRAEVWEDSFVEASWDAKRLEFITGEKSPDNNLKTALMRLVHLARNYLAQVGTDRAGAEEDESCHFFTRAELFDEYPEEWVKSINLDDAEQDSDWVKWHFERLVEANVFTFCIRRGEEYYGIAPEWRVRRYDLSAPPVPRQFPEAVQMSAGKKIKEPDRIKWLRETLGYEGDYNSIERTLAAAFAPSALGKDAVKVGGLILDELKSNNLRPFLLEAAREYATQYLSKWPIAKWPRWLQGTAQELSEVSGKTEHSKTKTESNSGRESEAINDGGILCF
jgi:hypothetical protein